MRLEVRITGIRPDAQSQNTPLRKKILIWEDIKTSFKNWSVVITRVICNPSTQIYPDLQRFDITCRMVKMESSLAMLYTHHWSAYLWIKDSHSRNEWAWRWEEPLSVTRLNQLVLNPSTGLLVNSSVYKFEVWTYFFLKSLLSVIAPPILPVASELSIAKIGKVNAEKKPGSSHKGPKARINAK